MKGDEEQSYLTCGMPPSNVARVISASLSGLLLEDLVPRMHVMDVVRQRRIACILAS